MRAYDEGEDNLYEVQKLIMVYTDISKQLALQQILSDARFATSQNKNGTCKALLYFEMLLHP